MRHPVHRPARTRACWLVLLPLVWAGLSGPIAACPFCGPVAEPLAHRRARATTVAVGETLTPAEPVPAEQIPTEQAPAGQRHQAFQLLATAVSGPTGLRLQPAAADTAAIVATVTATFTGTAVLFHEQAGNWQAFPADELLIDYCLSAPPPASEAAADADRLRWFVRWLEHPNATIAADAYAECAVAPFDAVRGAAEAFDANQLAGWLTDAAIDPQRCGFYGLAAGLVARQRQDHDAEVCRRALQAAVSMRHASDFRAGTEGLFAGLLIADGRAALATFESLGLFTVSGSPVAQRQLLRALRFAWEEPADTLPRDQVVHATRRLLTLPHLAREAVIDLARYQAWDACRDVVRLWDELGPTDPLIRPAVAGYLLACPLPEAARALANLRVQDPDGVAAAIEASRLPLPAGAE